VRGPAPVKLQGIGRVLLIRLRRIGDLVSVTPCTRAIKETFPQARLSVLVEKAGQGVLLGNPYVDELIVLDDEGLKRAGPLGKIRREIAFLLSLRRKAFDLVINLHGGPRSAVQTLLSGARHRLGGFARSHRWNWVYTIRPRHLHEVLGEGAGTSTVVERHLATLEAAGIHTSDSSLVMRGTGEAEASLDRLLRQKGVGAGERLVTINPAARNWQARWREERFAELADWLIQEFDVTILLVSGPQEADICRRVREKMRRPAVDLAGLTSLQELAVLLGRSALFVGLDGGPVHIAAAMRTPLIALYGPTTNAWRPWSDRALVVRGPVPCLGCRPACPSNPSRCMDGIEVGHVIEAVRKLDWWGGAGAALAGRAGPHPDQRGGVA